MSGQTEGAIKRTIDYGGAIEKEVDVTQGKTFIRSDLPEGLGYTEEVINSTSAAPGTAPASIDERFFLKDHLGSVNVIIDGLGAERLRMSYDAWGRRRNTTGTDDLWTGLGTLANSEDNTGYTGQEQLDNVGLVHLNGRVYDPITGRMVSADPTVPDATDLQAWNRYSYALNRPLRYVDPTGFSAEDVVERFVVTGCRSCQDDVAPVVKGFAIVGSPMALTTGGMGGGGAVLRIGLWVARVIPVVTACPVCGAAIAVAVAYKGYKAYQRYKAAAQSDTSDEGALDAGADSGQWEVPEEAKDKIPAEWGEAKPNRKGDGERWQDPNDKGSGVRIDKGNPESSQPSQQVDHVVVRDKGKVIGRDGQPINGSIKENPSQAHIPLNEWVKWSSWNKP